MPTLAEKALIARRKAAATGAVLVPIMERLLEHECIPEDEEDFRFLDMLVRARALPRRPGVFSPSMLGSCMRQAWFAKRGEKKLRAPNTQANGYFLNGNFVHFKWQFAMWKAHRAGLLELVKVPIGHEYEIITDLFKRQLIAYEPAHAWMKALDFYGDDTRPGVEVRVIDDDWGGTIDVLARIAERPYVVDYKGLRLDEFLRTVKKGASPEYRKQIVGYSGIANKVLGLKPAIENALLVCECKAGPVTGVGSPLALHETLVPVEEFTGEVTRRLRTLRFHDTRDVMPAIECVSTLHMGFQGCPFNARCRDEVLVVQRERERVARAGQKAATVARPKRDS